MGDVLKKFGRYFLLDHVAQGGMAEIFRARLAAQDGAGRILVIKRIQAGFGTNIEFLQMFKSETKVMMGFNHPNIVQLYDFGEELEQPYIAMEFVDGKNLRQMMTRFNERKEAFPVELASLVIEQSACGLHYAHSYRDKLTGQPLALVHRDISPQNLLISYDGGVKVIDFGIAKASTNSEATRAGVIKGKPSYLSPEQITGEVLDGRCDIFALGIVFWELLVGKKLFAGENDLAVLKLIESSTSHVKAPSSLNPKVPKELDYIVLRALAKQREKRYQTAEELQRAIRKFLTAYAPELASSDLSDQVREMFKDEIVEDRKRMQRLNEKAEQLLTASGYESPARPLVSPDSAPTALLDQMLVSTGSREIVAEKKEKIELVNVDNGRAFNPTRATRRRPSDPVPPSPARGTQATPPPQRIRPGQENAAGGMVLKTLLAAGAAVLGLVYLGPQFGINLLPNDSASTRDPASTPAAKAEINTLQLLGEAKDVSVLVDGQKAASALPATLTNLATDHAVHLTVTGPAGTFEQDIALKAGDRKRINIVFTQRAAAAKGTITLRLNMVPGGGSPRIKLNGKDLDPTNPMATVKLDEPQELSVERPDFRRFRREFVLESQQLAGLKEWLMDVPLEPLKFGLLSVRTSVSAEATIMIGDKPWVKRLPFDNERLPAGTYNIRIRNDAIGAEKTVTVNIREGGSVDLGEVKLEMRD